MLHLWNARCYFRPSFIGSGIAELFVWYLPVTCWKLDEKPTENPSTGSQGSYEFDMKARGTQLQSGCEIGVCRWVSWRIDS